MSRIDDVTTSLYAQVSIIIFKIILDSLHKKLLKIEIDLINGYNLLLNILFPE